MANIISKKPAECSYRELKFFSEKVFELRGIDLSKLIKKAVVLVFACDEEGFLGIGALKGKNRKHRDEIFQKAEISDFESYDFELGWIYVEAKKRKVGIGEEILLKLISKAENQKLFAVTREDNYPMVKLLERFGFRKKGNSCHSKNGNYEFRILLRKL